MIEFEFGADDLAGARFGISPLEHLRTGVIADGRAHVLGASARRDRWWRSVRRLAPARATMLIELVNASPDGAACFLNTDLDGGVRHLADELDQMMATPADVVAKGLSFYGTGRVPRVVEQMRGGATCDLRRLADSAWSLYTSCLVDDWADIQRSLHTDIADREQTMAARGPGAVLDGLHPRLARRGHTLLLDRRYGPQSFDLAGRGLRLRPNFFLQDGIGILRDDRHRPAVLYPIANQHAGSTAPGRRGDGLAGLIGKGRAKALRAIGLGACTTTELAGRLGISPPSASAHAVALRDAGLITTRRDGRSVQHALTDIGRALLSANPRSSSSSSGHGTVGTRLWSGMRPKALPSVQLPGPSE